MPLPDLRINPYVAPYQGGISPEFSQTIDERINQFDTNAEFSDVLAYQSDNLLQSVSPFEGDVQYAKQIMNNTRQQIDEWSQRGDFENIGREIKRGARNFQQQITPLIENQKRYSSYLSEMENAYKKGDIGFDTYQKAKAASINGYRGLDPNNISGTMFNGFTPSKDINITKKVDDFLTDWKANGGSKLIPVGDGSYVEKKWESADETEIANAAAEALFGDSEFTGYAQTQGAIGNQQRVKDEFRQAISAGAKKHGFYKEDLSLSWMPQYAFENQQALKIAQQLPQVPSSVTTNPGAQDVFISQGLTQDDTTGKIVPSTLYTKRDGKYYKTIDSQGNIVDPTKISIKDIPSTGAIAAGAVPKYKQVEVPEDEVTMHTIEANQTLVDMAANKFLKEQLDKGNIRVDGYLADANLTKAYLKKNEHIFTSPAYLKQTRKEYDEAIKNAQQITDNKRWDISLISGASNPEFTTLKDDDILANLSGQSIGILDTDIGGFRKGQRADLQSMLDKLQEEDGYVVKTVRRLGPLQYNPYSNLPGMSYAINLEDKDGKKKTVEIAASMEDTELQPIQDIYNMAYKGLSGQTRFFAPNTPKGAMSGSLRLRMATSKIDGKQKFTGFVEILDNNGKKINIPGYEYIPIDQFGDIYKQIFAPNLVTKYINPKYRPKEE